MQVLNPASEWSPKLNNKPHYMDSDKRKSQTQPLTHSATAEALMEHEDPVIQQFARGGLAKDEFSKLTPKQVSIIVTASIKENELNVFNDLF